MADILPFRTLSRGGDLHGREAVAARQEVQEDVRLTCQDVQPGGDAVSEAHAGEAVSKDGGDDFADPVLDSASLTYTKDVGAATKASPRWLRQLVGLLPWIM